MARNLFAHVAWLLSTKWFYESTRKKLSLSLQIYALLNCCSQHSLIWSCFHINW